MKFKFLKILLKTLRSENNNIIKDVLDKSHRKLVMVVERKFGRNRDYLKQLQELQKMIIGPVMYTSGMSQSYIDNVVRKDLIKKRDRYLNLIDTILDEIKIESSIELKGKKPDNQVEEKLKVS